MIRALLVLLLATVFTPPAHGAVLKRGPGGMLIGVNSPIDTDGDGLTDYTLVGDYDGDGTCEMEDLQLAYNDLTDTDTMRYMDILPCVYEAPADADLMSSGDPTRGLLEVGSHTTVACRNGAVLQSYQGFSNTDAGAERYATIASAGTDGQRDIHVVGCELDGGLWGWTPESLTGGDATSIDHAGANFDTRRQFRSDVDYLVIRPDKPGRCSGGENDQMSCWADWQCDTGYQDPLTGDGSCEFWESPSPHVEYCEYDVTDSDTLTCEAGTINGSDNAWTSNPADGDLYMVMHRGDLFDANFSIAQRHAIGLSGVTDFSVERNRIYGYPNACINLEDSNNGIVRNNQFNNCGNWSDVVNTAPSTGYSTYQGTPAIGIESNGTDPVRRFDISDNLIYGVRSAAVVTGGDATTSISDILINNNHVKWAEKGLAILQGTEGVEFFGNLVEWSTGVQVHQYPTNAAGGEVGFRSDAACVKCNRGIVFTNETYLNPVPWYGGSSNSVFLLGSFSEDVTIKNVTCQWDQDHEPFYNNSADPMTCIQYTPPIRSLFIENTSVKNAPGHGFSIRTVDTFGTTNVSVANDTLDLNPTGSADYTFPVGRTSAGRLQGPFFLTGSLPTGTPTPAINTPYWIYNECGTCSGTTFQLLSQPSEDAVVDLTSTTAPTLSSRSYGWNSDEGIVFQGFQADGCGASGYPTTGGYNCIDVQGYGRGLTIKNGLVSRAGPAGAGIKISGATHGLTVMDYVVDGGPTWSLGAGDDAELPCDAGRLGAVAYHEDDSGGTCSGGGSTVNLCYCRSECTGGSNDGTECDGDSTCTGGGTCTAYDWADVANNAAGIEIDDTTPNHVGISLSDLTLRNVSLLTGIDVNDAVSGLYLDGSTAVMTDVSDRSSNAASTTSAFWQQGLMDLVAGASEVRVGNHQCLNPYRSGTRGLAQVVTSFYGDECVSFPSVSGCDALNRDYGIFGADMVFRSSENSAGDGPGCCEGGSDATDGDSCGEDADCTGTCDLGAGGTDVTCVAGQTFINEDGDAVFRCSSADGSADQIWRRVDY